MTDDVLARVGRIALPRATDPAEHGRHFGGHSDLLPLWIAEPYLPLAEPVTAALRARAEAGWFGYENRPDELIALFWAWMGRRHGWDGSTSRTLVSPSVGTSIATLIEQHSRPGDGVILQPPVFTDFKPLVVNADRRVERNPLRLTPEGYCMDLDSLAAAAAAPANRMLILCNPHNPVGRVWTFDELAAVAAICAEHEIVVVADEIHADIVMAGSSFTPFATAAARTGVRWAATHGPIKTFGLAGVCDTLLVTADDDIADRFEAASSRLHLTRNHGFSLTALRAAYGAAEPWFDRFLDQIAANFAQLAAELPEGIDLVRAEGTYLAWLDFRALGMDVPELAEWLVSAARLALSPGHWFGREGAGFARLTVAAPTSSIDEAIARLHGAVGGRTTP